MQLTDSYQVDVGLFLSPVIHWGADSGTVVLNIRCSGSWGREIREKDNFPFEADEKFTIEIIFREDQYEVCGFGIKINSMCYKCFLYQGT